MSSILFICNGWEIKDNENEKEIEDNKDKSEEEDKKA